MSEHPLSKGIRLVKGGKMLNFVVWLATYYPNLHSLSRLNDDELIQLTTEFEREREDLEPNSVKSWKESIKEMEKGNREYLTSRAVLEKSP